ncbi:zinc ribbon domain-containing protein [Nocardioides limicola]|uniref:zinc ribbon domain-containing protein n=1 Tax=Nocardioides limicola TaxID=2803368 RepID=UPI0027DE4934|nr:C4-type zinc ribbon domain-containing protein [Nocardioides sp. DJM-14]
MKADPVAQLTLLDVQTADAKADQLRHQLANLPELARIAELTAERTELDNATRDVRIKVDDLSVEQRQVDAEVEQVKARRTRDQQRLEAGQVTKPADIERMQHEMVSLERRIAKLEDDELEVMQQVEDAQAELTELTARVTNIDVELESLAKSRDEKAGVLEQQLADQVSDRTGLIADMPAELLALYERLRAAKGGVGAAMLRARRCEGCMLTLDNAELAQIKQKPADEVLRCEECQRILIRTDESGL